MSVSSLRQNNNANGKWKRTNEKTTKQITTTTTTTTKIIWVLTYLLRCNGWFKMRQHTCKTHIYTIWPDVQKITPLRHHHNPIPCEKQQRTNVNETNKLPYDTLHKYERTNQPKYSFARAARVYVCEHWTVSPMIFVPNQLVGAPSGTDVTIDCNTESHPKFVFFCIAIS